MNREKTRLWHTVREYGIVTIISLAVTFVLLRLWRADISMPFSFTGDALFTLNLARNMIESGWGYRNELLGAPYGHQLYDFPLGDTVHLLVFRLFSLITLNPALIVNLYYILSYPLAVLTSYFVARRLQISRIGALCVGLLFAFLPYHFIRSVNHFFYSLYFAIPLITLVFLRLFHDPIVFRPGQGPFWKRIALKGWWPVYAMAISLFVGLGGIYFAFFSLFFIGIAVLSQFLERKDITPLIAGAFFSVIIVGGVVLQHIPNYVFYATEGRNTAVAQRSPHESELYGLKITYLVMPNWTPLPAIKNIRDVYFATTPKNGDQAAYLGIAGVIGLGILLIWLLRPLSMLKENVLSRLAILNLTGILLGTVGGGSALVAFTVFTQIRAYNRISIFLAFFCILAFVILVEALGKWKYTKRLAAGLPYALLLITGLSLVEQTRYLTPDYQTINNLTRAYQTHVRAIEPLVSEKAMIFQLPYKEFPESAPVHNVTDYDLMRPSFFSRSLRWSYAAIKGREGDAWIRNISALPPDKMAEALAGKGFEGILIDRYGYVDGGIALEASLSALLKVKPVTGVDNRLAFYPLQRFFQERIASLSAQQRDALNQSYSRMVMRIGAGFFATETDGLKSWTWCLNNDLCTVEIVNFSDDTVTATLHMQVETGYPRPSQLRIEGGAADRNYTISSTASDVTFRLNAQPGITSLKLSTTEIPFTVPNDPRFMYFRIINPYIDSQTDTQ